MSWASHPTNEMPATSDNAVGRHRRRRTSIIGITAAALLLVLAVGGALLSPILLGWPPPAPKNATADGLAGSELPSLILSPTDATSTPPPTALPASPTPAKATPSTQAVAAVPDPVATGIDSMETEVVRLTNAERTGHGCPALRADAKLRTAARNHSAAMAMLEKLTHTGADGSNPGIRMKLAGYNIDGGWAENVAYGYPTPQAVMTGWMSSDGHRNNILNCSLKAIGVGVARTSDGQLYWTQDFGGR